MSLPQASPKRHPSFPSFALPPLDGSLTLPDLYEWHSIHSSQHPLFKYEASPGNIRTILWEDALPGMNYAAQHCRNVVGSQKLDARGELPVIAILGSLDSITYTFLILGIMRAGGVAFPVSPRNSPAAVAHLLTKTNSHDVFVSPDRAMQDLMAAAKLLVPVTFDLLVHVAPTYDDLFPSGGGISERVVFTPPKRAQHEQAAIYHSSGSTAFPKPIYLKNSTFTQFAATILSSEGDFCGKVLAVHALPMSHVMGMFSVTLAAAAGGIGAVFKPRSPPTMPNPANFIEGIKNSRADILFSPAIFLEEWSSSRESISILEGLDYVMYGGGPLAQEAGDFLVSEGVNVVTCYGAVEVPLISHFLPSVIGKDWDYFKFNLDLKIHLVELGDNEYTFAVLRSDNFEPNVIDTNVDRVDGCLIKDIVSPHPTRKGLWKVVGRVDDQIMHSTGEKTNPGPLEKMLMADSHVSGAVMFGRSRFFVGALVSPKSQYAFDPREEEKLAEFRSLIWPTVEKMNTYAPQHSRLFKEMIIATSAAKPFQYTGKGTIRRQACIAVYEEEIEAAYGAVARSSLASINPPTTWDLQGIKTFVNSVVVYVMKDASEKVKDDTELFQAGLDSLQATWIRNTIFRTFREHYPNAVRGLSANIVFEHPTISSLADSLSNTISGFSEETIDNTEQKRRKVLALLDKYTRNVPKRIEGRSSPASLTKVVLLTGGTGSLGTNILARLLGRDDVSRIYALSRAGSSGSTSKDRHVQAFEREHESKDILSDTRVEFLEGDTALDHFGLPNDKFEQIQAEITHIIHNGWRVNFGNSLLSFESNIRGVRNLADFTLAARTGRAHIIFVSSSGIFMNFDRDEAALETTLSKPDTALGFGYAESKWVSEQILQTYASQNFLNATTVRCGQMTGGRTGAWNEHEWFPSIVKSSVALGMFPDAEGEISWITGYNAGGAVVDMLDAKEEVLHIVHPRPVPWNTIASAFAKELNLPLVPYQKWLEGLERKFAEAGQKPAQIGQAFADVPALRLIDFFRAAKPVPGLEPLGMRPLASEKAQLSSRTLREAEKIGPKDVEKWVAFWRKSGFLPSC